jgi:Kef-type K+ transport system membrane component KefB
MTAIVNSIELQYLILFSILLILPKLLLRFHIPVGISSICLGIITALGLGWFENDQLLLMLSRLGITSLFLFAGLEIEVEELRRDGAALGAHVLQTIVITCAIAVGFFYIFDLAPRASLLLALAIMTPSTGFILNSLKNYGFSEEQQYWIRSKAIAKEIGAIFLLFIALQSDSLTQLGTSSGILLALICFLPIMFKLFFKFIAPYAPDSEVGFLILTALICGVLTKKIGTYYLVGAFIVGVIASEFKHFGKSEKAEPILKHLGIFFSFFIPFYFFKAGLSFTKDLFTIEGLIIGMIFLLVFIPLRIFLVYSTLRFFIKDFWKDRAEISTSLLPTLIFGLVIAGILKERFDLDPKIMSGLIVYTLFSSIIPAVVFKKTPPESFV